MNPLIKPAWPTAIYLLLVLVAAVSTACRRSSEHGKPEESVSVVDAHGKSVRIADSSRIVTVGGAVTEIAFALGAGSRVVGVDTSSIYPEAATKLPKVGYQRQLSSEGVLALRPTLVLASADAGPPPAIEQLRSSGVAVLVVTADHNLDGARARMRSVAQALRLEEQGRRLLESLEREVVEGRARTSASPDKPKVLFIYARGQGTVNVSGRGTAADEMMSLAGGTNAVTEFEGYRPLTADAAVGAAPDVILVPEKGLESLGGMDAVLRLPGLSLTAPGRAPLCGRARHGLSDAGRRGRRGR